MRLSSVQVLYPGKAQSDGVVPKTLTVNKDGIKSLLKLDDMSVEVVGVRSSYIIWPANILWAEPLSALAPSQPALQPVTPQAVAAPSPSPSPSPVAQTAEHVAVNDGDESSTLSGGANPSGDNTLALEATPLAPPISEASIAISKDDPQLVAEAAPSPGRESEDAISASKPEGPGSIPGAPAEKQARKWQRKGKKEKG